MSKSYFKAPQKALKSSWKDEYFKAPKQTGLIKKSLSRRSHAIVRIDGKSTNGLNNVHTY